MSAQPEYEVRVRIDCFAAAVWPLHVCLERGLASAVKALVSLAAELSVAVVAEPIWDLELQLRRLHWPSSCLSDSAGFEPEDELIDEMVEDVAVPE